MFNKIINRENISRIVGVEIEKFYNYNESTINRLEKVHIKLGYRKNLRIINNRIKLIL